MPRNRIRPIALLGAVAAVTALAACSTGEAAPGASESADVLTIATGQPAYPPYVIDDAPESGEGFEAAVAYAVAEELGYEADQVEWVRSTFDQGIAPGAKDWSKVLRTHSTWSDTRPTRSSGCAAPSTRASRPAPRTGT